MRKLSMKPQQVIKDAAWYYENPKFIDLMIDTRCFPINSVIQIRIPMRKLKKTIQRQEGE